MVSQLALFTASDAPPSASPEVRYLFLPPVLYVSPVMTIGRHEWAYVIYDDPHWGVLADYVWRRSGAEWARSRAWPSYDGDRSDGGLPLTCRRLWEREAQARAAHGLP